MTEYRIISSSGTQEITGSIAKIYCLANGSLSRTEWGLFTIPESKFTPTSVISTPISLDKGRTLEGPLGRAKVGSGNFLFYIEG